MDVPEYKPTNKEKRFLKYYERLIRETIFARAHLKLNERLENYKSSYLRELKQAPHFFSFTIKGHGDDAILTLSRILDKHEDSLSIWKFLNFVEQNRRIFSDQAFCERMKGNPNYEYLIKSHTPITLKEIQEDRQKLESLRGTIDRIKKWRDKVLAHTDRKFYIEGEAISKKYSLPYQELQEVIDTILNIQNRYSGAYNSSGWAERFLGEDDVQHVMDSIRLQIQERRKQLEALKRQSRDNR